MFKRIESWLRRIISEVVADVVRVERVTRADSRELLAEALGAFKAEVARVHSEELAAFTKMHNDAVAELTEVHAKVVAEKTQLLAEANAKVADLKEALHKFTQWTADEATKAADAVHQEVKKL